MKTNKKIVKRIVRRKMFKPFVFMPMPLLSLITLSANKKGTSQARIKSFIFLKFYKKNNFEFLALITIYLLSLLINNKEQLEIEIIFKI